MHLNGENKINVIKWVETRDEHAKVLKIYVRVPGVCLLLPGGYIHAYNISATAWPIKATLHGKGTKDCINGRHGYKLQKPLKCSSEPVGL